MKNMGLIDMNELTARIHREHMRHLRKKRVGLLSVAVMVTGLVIWQADTINALKGTSVKLAEEKEAAVKELTITKNELNGIKQAMTVSIDARKLGRPVRLSGEMIVVFAGEVKDK